MEKSKDHEVAIDLCKNRIGIIEDYVTKAIESIDELYDVHYNLRKFILKMESQLSDHASTIYCLKDELLDVKATLEGLKAGHGE